MTAAPPRPGGGPSIKTSHEIVAIGAFELIGVGVLAVIADTNETIGNIIVIFMVGIFLWWFIARGSAYLSHVTQGVQALTGK